MNEKFETGKLFLTCGVNSKVAESRNFSMFVFNSLHRHKIGDWGDCDPADAKENNFAIDKHLRIFSVYKNGTDKIWIITEADRSTTTILFPSEY